MGIAVRRADIGDIGEILRLLAQIAEYHHDGRPDIFKGNSRKYGADEFKAILADGDRPVFVAADEAGKIAGYCFCMVVRYAEHAVFKDHSTLYIDDFCVDAERRRQGIGRLLFAEVKSYAERGGIDIIDLNVWEFNEAAIKFYESLGFATQRRRMEMKAQSL